MDLWTKVVKGGPTCKTRLHTGDGEMVDMAGMAFLPQAMASTLGRCLFNRRPAVPWLGYRAIRRLEGLLQPNWRMIEYGSGMSTVWFARRVAKVYSIENYGPWYAKVTEILKNAGVANVDYQLLEGEPYAEAAHVPDGSIDFILNDGLQRFECLQTGLRKLKPGGWIYLDNADKCHGDPNADLPKARQLLEDTAERYGRKCEHFVDLFPTYLAVTRGMLLQLPDTYPPRG